MDQSIAEWKEAVARDKTLIGYWRWVEEKKRAYEAKAWKEFIDELESEKSGEDYISYLERLKTKAQSFT